MLNCGFMDQFKVAMLFNCRFVPDIVEGVFVDGHWKPYWRLILFAQETDFLLLLYRCIQILRAGLGGETCLVIRQAAMREASISTGVLICCSVTR